MLRINHIRKKLPNYKISYFPSQDYYIGIKGDYNERYRKDNVFIASNDKKWWILYFDDLAFTGHFTTRKEAIKWFRNKGR